MNRLTNICFLCLYVFLPLLTVAQNITFRYDDAGNREARVISMLRSPASGWKSGLAKKSRRGKLL